MRYLRNYTGEMSGALAATGGRKAFDRYLISGVLIALFWMLIMPNPLQAALIGLQASPGSPDIKTSGTAIAYDYVGTGGQLTIKSYSSDNKVVQTLTVPGPDSVWGTSAQQTWKINDPLATGSAFLRSTYTLTANFNASGVFTDGTVTIGGAVDTSGLAGIQYAPPLDPTLGDATTNPCWHLCSGYGGSAPVLLSGNLLGFGFKATPDATGNHDALQMDWFMEVGGGDMATAGFDSSGIRYDVGVIASGLVTWGDGLTAGSNGSYGASWDPLDTNNTAAFLQDFRSCDPPPPGASGGRCEVLLDTFVPVPAAVWLFGSGLMGLFGFGARNRARSRPAA